MSGMFLNACTVPGGASDDTFNGRFINSAIDGGEGGQCSAIRACP